MEAMTGATVAALTVYDMCKALSHDIEITGVRLLAKTGGKRDFNRSSTRRASGRKIPHGSPLYGLVLAGGRSTRMQRDKATLTYQGEISSTARWNCLEPCVVQAFVSVRPDQREDPARARYAQIVDAHEGMGPIAGIAAAQALQPARVAGAGL